MPPLVRRYPALATLPRTRLCQLPTPVQRVDALGRGLWLKREDLSAQPLGGNKARALEYLLGGVRQGDRVVTVGAAGSTHALATAIHARRLGARPIVFRWRQEMNDVARRVAERLDADVAGSGGHTVVGAYLRAIVARLRGAHWVPAGGSNALGVLGQVNAALELVDQVRAGELPQPDRIVLPLGTGGTTAGVALGLAIAGVNAETIAVRVVPRIVANRRRVRRLVEQTARLIERATQGSVPRPTPESLRIVHDQYGGAYGRATAAGVDVARRASEQFGIPIDLTYSAKALAAAVRVAAREGGTTLFWLSFDGRWLASR